ncbi:MULTISPECIES: choice-of-anchor L domain-containing protein [Winogradskyella]|uniref:choice-of-anchor L domain-containing protein n=1 Tax=Winogradskyella TaxID=286104 RepID=UPI0015C7998A|nr:MULTISPECIES: choice-of-anchor L domain-containing protein [Winogradskyella]QXP78296.1 choice-of-anchor L domain-containing protein [Winogradskyella sp. HaHa_3_26]
MKKNIFKLTFLAFCLLGSSIALCQTIPSPVGVSCSSNNSTYVFTEEFDDSDGWVGDITTNNIGGNWEVPGNSDSSGTGPSSAFSGSHYMNYEASGNVNQASSSIISPVIDLTTATDGAELSFYLHAYGDNMGELEVGVSTSISGPFTNVFTWTGELQTSSSEAWVPVGVNLDAYLGQSIYLEFKNTRATFSGRADMSIDLVRVETCGTFCISPTLSLNYVNSNASSASASFYWDANDSETSWEYVVQPSGSGIPASGIVSTVTNIIANDLLFGTAYEVYVRANCTNGNSIWAGPLTFTTPIQTNFIVDCSAGPLVESLCYGDGGVTNPEVFTFTSTDGTPLTLTFQSGYVQQGWDPLVVIDTDGSSIVAFEDYFFGDEGDLTGVTYTSTGNRISFYVASDDFVPSSCANGDDPMRGGITYTVNCATCTNSESTFTIVDDCDTGDQFLLDVNVTSLGTASSLTLSNNIDLNTTTINAVGTYQIGPFPFLTDVIYTLSNDQDINCVYDSLPIEVRACLPDNDECLNAEIAVVNTGDDCTLLNYGTILSATPSNVSGTSCEGDPDDDVWFQFVALNDIQIIEFINIVENEVSSGLNHAVYEGACGSLNELYCSDSNSSVTPQLTIGDTYYIRVFSAGSEDENVTFDLCIRKGFNSIEVSDNVYTVDELVRDILFNSPCAQVSNITYSTGINFNDSQPNGIGYFSMDGDGFPFEQGLLLSTGHVVEAAGPNDELINSGGTSWPGDSDLDDLLGVSSRNATIIEFDFVPLSNTISFDFMMASEEYTGATGGTDECTYSDAFAFLLTDAENNTTNLAVIPGTTTPILTTNIHPENASCPAINEEYFGEYITEDLPPMNFNGRTVVFTAQSPVVIGETYHIKLVVADDTDTQYDTGIFLKSGSFDIGELDLGDDITIEAGTASCLNEPMVLDTNLPNLEHYWFKNGLLLADATGSVITATEPGVYTAQVIFSSNCILSDEIVVEFLSVPVANPAIDLIECSTTNQALFNLEENDSYILGSQNASDYSITYHVSEQDAIDQLSPLPSVYSNISNPQVVYARIEDNNSGCFSTTSFSLMTTAPSHTALSVDFIACDFDNDGFASFNLEDHDFEILNGQEASQYHVSYYTSEAEAISATNALSGSYDSTGETLFVRVESVDFSDCYVTNSFDLIIGNQPITNFSSDVDYEVCSNASSPIDIEAIPENYSLSEVSISWYRDGGLIADETSLTLPVLEAGLYEIEVLFNATGCIGVAEFTIIELETCVFPEGISPGVTPGQNDTFDLSSFGVTKLEIFNRYGTLVYSKDNYRNEWHGQTNDGDDLPVGTYFYTVIYEGGAKSKSAWVYINR